jgi:hypothetical protein
MRYAIIDTNIDSVESTHETIEQARAHYQGQCFVTEWRSGRGEVRRTTYGLHHRVRDERTGQWVEL